MGWTAKTSPMSGDSSAYVNDAALSSTGIVVAVGASVVGDAVPPVVLVMRSLDGGDTWAESSSYPWDDSSSFNAYYVTWCEFLGLFVACGYTFADGSVVCSSPDGDVWTAIWTNPTSIAANKPISCDAISLVSIPGTDFTGADSGIVLTTPDGSTVTLHTGTIVMKYPAVGTWSDVDGTAVVAGYTTAPGKAINRSTDGINYAAIASPLDDAVLSRGYHAGYMPAAGVWLVSGQKSTSDLTVRSDDGGLTWALTTVPHDDRNPSGELLDGRILVGSAPVAAVSSDGGLTWTDSPLNPNQCGVSAVIAIPAFGRNLVTGCVGNPQNDVAMTGTPPRVLPTPTGLIPPLWRYVIADLSGRAITNYERLASARQVQVLLDGPLSMSGTVPSANPQANIPYDGDGFYDPYLNEGTRLLWGFRLESRTAPYYTVRAATIINLISDVAEQDDAASTFTGWDPWHLMFTRPVIDNDGNLPPPDGLTMEKLMGDPAPQVADVIRQLLLNTITYHGFAFIDAGVDYGGSSDWAGTIDTGAGMVVTESLPQGSTVGSVWQQYTQQGVCDLVLTPVYSPFGRTLPDFSTAYNFLVDLSVLTQAGVVNDNAVFAWDAPRRSLVGINREIDGSQRATSAVYYAGVNGWSGKSTLETDAAAVVKFGDYWSLQAFPAISGTGSVAAVQSLAEQQVALRRLGKSTVTFSPAPERSPRPWIDFGIGDRCPVWALPESFRALLVGSKAFIISADAATLSFLVAGDFRLQYSPDVQFVAYEAGVNSGAFTVDSVGFDGTNTTIFTTVAPVDAGEAGFLAVVPYQRIWGWTANIDDDALETLRPVLTSPEGFTQ